MAVSYQNYKVERVNNRLRMYGDIYLFNNKIASLGPDGIDFSDWYDAQSDSVQQEIALLAGLQFVLPMLLGSTQNDG